MVIIILCSLFITHIGIGLAVMDRDSRVEALLTAEATDIMERLQRGDQALYGLMKGRFDSISVAADGSSIDFSVDTNSVYTADTADDIQMSIYYDNGDGDDATYEDNAVMFDPDTSMAGDEFVVGRNVSDLNFEDDAATNMVTIDVELTAMRGAEEVTVTFSREVYMRN